MTWVIVGISLGIAVVAIVVAIPREMPTITHVMLAPEDEGQWCSRSPLRPSTRIWNTVNRTVL
jgi:hypothetical protein